MHDGYFSEEQKVIWRKNTQKKRHSLQDIFVCNVAIDSWDGFGSRRKYKALHVFASLSPSLTLYLFLFRSLSRLPMEKRPKKHENRWGG